MACTQRAASELRRTACLERAGNATLLPDGCNYERASVPELVCRWWVIYVVLLMFPA
jgi:hypothetical protein